MKPITFAHRGGRADRVENTLEAFSHAKDRGATGVESDVRLSGDGVPVLAHDATLRRGVRRVKVAGAPAVELAGLDVPRLADLYEAVGTGMQVSLDVKTPVAGVPSIEVARAAGDEARERLWLCSPDLDVLRELRDRDPTVRLVHSTTRRAIFESIERHAATLAEERIDAFNLHRTEWSKGLVTLFHRFAVLAFAWDAQEARHLREVLAYGVDGVYSDHVDRMVAVVAEFDTSAREDPGPPG